MSRANLTRLSSLKDKEKDVSKKNLNIYIAPWRLKTQSCLKDRELNQARSKPDTVDVPATTAHIFVHHYNSTHYCNKETVLIYIPLPPDQHHISDVAKWRWGGNKTKITLIQTHHVISKPRSFYNSNKCHLWCDHKNRPEQILRQRESKKNAIIGWSIKQRTNRHVLVSPVLYVDLSVVECSPDFPTFQLLCTSGISTLMQNRKFTLSYFGISHNGIWSNEFSSII